MALKSTVFKVVLDVADMDRNHYQQHSLTLARHPSENDERMMVRLLAFARHADEQLQFGKGLCVEEEPALWQKSLSGEDELWILLGQPDEKWVKKACNKADRVVIYCYQPRAAQVWWEQNQQVLQRYNNLSLYLFDYSEQLLTLAKRTMQLQCTIQDGELWLTDGEASVEVKITPWQVAE